MNNWISALAELQQQGEPCVLVTIIEEQGSTPRNAGSKRVIRADKIFDTIGGGHLEYKAMEIARQMLENTDVEIKQIAVILEYADASAFARAFRRWSGITPGQFRQGLGQ